MSHLGHSRRSQVSPTLNGHRIPETNNPRSPMKRGMSFNFHLSGGGTNSRPPKSPHRPKSADVSSFGCIKSAPELPCFSKPLTTTPSDDGSDTTDFITVCSDIKTKNDSPSAETSSGGFFQRLFSRARSKSRDRRRGTLETQCLLGSVTLCDGCEKTDIDLSDNSRSNDQASLEETKACIQEIDVKIQRYESLSPLPPQPNLFRPCPTPPLAVFSSDEDISSVPQTPKKQCSTSNGHLQNNNDYTTRALESKLVNSKLEAVKDELKNENSARESLLETQTRAEDTTVNTNSNLLETSNSDSIPRTSSVKTISPELEQEISKVFLEPPDPILGSRVHILRSHSLQEPHRPSPLSSSQSAALVPSLYTPTKVVRQPKYSRRKHYTIDFGSLSMVEAHTGTDAIPPPRTQRKRSVALQQTGRHSFILSEADPNPKFVIGEDFNQSDSLPRTDLRADLTPDGHVTLRKIPPRRRPRPQSDSLTPVPVLHYSTVMKEKHRPSSVCLDNNLSTSENISCPRYQRHMLMRQTSAPVKTDQTKDYETDRRNTQPGTDSPKRDPNLKYYPLSCWRFNRRSKDSESLDSSPTHVSHVLKRQNEVDEPDDALEDPEQVPLLLEEVASNDSGIQQDETPTSSESLKFVCQLDTTPLLSPLKNNSVLDNTRRSKRDRPKSECLSVHWADSRNRNSYNSLESSTENPDSFSSHSTGGSTLVASPAHSIEGSAGQSQPKTKNRVSIEPALINTVVKRSKLKIKERPKSDIESIVEETDLEGSSQGLSDTLQHLLRRDRVGLSTSCLAPPDGSTTLTDTRRNLRNRRMSTPQPIRSRQATASFSTAQYRPRRPQLKRARSAPNLQDMSNGQKHFRKVHKDVYKVGSAAAGDLALQPPEFNSDEEGSDDSIYETISLGDSTLSLPKQTTLEEIFECEEVPTFVEALWDHVTMDGEELGFRAGDVIEVTDLSDKEWWYGRISHDQGWFPAAFVRLRANQIELITEDGDFCVTPEGDGHITHAPLQAVESISQTQARTNVVKEILHAEREYVRHLRDVVQGYVEKCNKRPEMFPAEKMSAIFGNISAIHRFSVMFMRDLERHVNLEQPHTSNLGKVFIKHSNGFEIYSEYCNNHPTACDVLRGLQKNKKYTHFFEACRLLQDMIELPLEGFLLTPVQKICKYPLQLKELLKYTPRSHPDHGKLVIALETMRRIAVMINERKRKMESLEKLAGWQHRIDDWQGPDLLEESSELIYTGEMVKVNNSGWHQERVFFLFDHQLIYCKKDMLWRDLLAYKGRISLDNCIIKALPDDIKDPVFHIQVKNGLRIYDNTQGRWYLMYCRTSEDRARWFQAFQQERQKVQEDDESGFDLHMFRQKANLPRVKPPAHPSVRYRERTQKHKKQQVRNEKLPPLPGQHSIPDSPNQSTDSTLTRRWNIFRKNKR